MGVINAKSVRRTKKRSRRVCNSKCLKELELACEHDKVAKELAARVQSQILRATTHNIPSGEENQWQHCKKCGRDMRFEFSIRKGIWEMLPRKWHDHVLCIECFLEELENIQNNIVLNINDFAFIGVIGEKFHGIIIDNPDVEVQ